MRKVMKVNDYLALSVVVVALLVISVPLRASAMDTDARIEASAKKSYVFQTYLKDDALTIASKDGIVILTGDGSRRVPDVLGPRDRDLPTRGEERGQPTRA